MTFSKESQLNRGKKLPALKDGKKKMPKIKTPQQIKKSLKDKCMIEWSKLIRINGWCAKCGRPGRTQAHHIIHRGHHVHPGWFRLDNGIELCANCHKFRGAHSTKLEDQLEFREWIRGWLKGKGRDYDTLKAICGSKGSIRTEDLRLLLYVLKQEVGLL